MKTYRRCIPAVIAILVLLGGCMNLLEPSGGEEPAPGGKGRVEIRIADNARTALPSAAFDKYVLRFAYAGTEGYAHDPAEWSSGLSVDLEPGVWTVILDAYTGAVVSGTGSAEVTVSAGTVTPVTIRIRVNTTAVVKGTLKYKVSYPTVGHTYGTQALSVRDTGGNLAGSPVTITNGAEGSLQLDPGVYFVGVVIEDTVQRTGAARTSAVHIYGGQETSLEITIGEEEFTALVPVTVTAGLTVSGSGLTVTSRAIAAYGEAGCTTLLGTANTTVLTGQAEITLWVPSADAKVYVRQEIVVNGTVALSTEAVEVNITDPGHSVPVSIADTLYKISLDTGIPSGTVTVTNAVSAAFEGDSVTVTVIPGDTRTLKSGSFKYHDGSTDISLGAGPSATFVMPGAEVTVKAEFYQFVRYGRAGGAGDGLSWETASDDIQKMMDELEALSLDSGTTGWGGDYVVKLGAGAYKPKYKPEASPGPYTYPAGGSDAAFILREGVQVRGGYTAGGEDIDETERTGRFGTYGEAAPEHKAILSGDLDNSGGIPDNSDAYHVVLAVDIAATSGTVLDGLTISGGNADSGGDILVGDKHIYRDSGGGMYNSASLPALIRVTISGNKAGYGGGMYNGSGSSPTLDNVTISGNTVSGSGSGGGMYNYGSSPELNNVMIGGASAADKNTAYNGGGMANNISASPMLNNVTIFGNTASSNGGGIYNNGPSMTMNGGFITGNTATNGGGMYNISSSSPALTNVTISKNEATTNGGGMYNDNSSPVLDGVTIGGSDPAKNTANQGGGMYNASSSSPELKNGTAISYNTAGTGGGMYNLASSPVLTNVTISGNAATDSGIYGNGGGMYNYDSPLALNSNVTISGNKAAYNGGGVYFVGSGETFTMNGGTISGNKTTGSSGSGGGVYVANGTFSMSGGTINGNLAVNNGGGVYVNSGTFTKSGGTIHGDTDNTPNNGSPDDNTAKTGKGHAVWVVNGSKKRNSTANSGDALDSQTSGTSGGWESSSPFSSSYIQSMIDSAAEGGTIAPDSGDYDMDTQLEINKTITINIGTSNETVVFKRHSSFTGDMIKITGGGSLTLQASGLNSSLTLDGMNVSDAGGSLVRVEGGTLTMNADVTLKNNKNPGNGGGVYVTTGSFVMSDGTISNNQAWEGGGVYVNSGTFTMSEGTISSNFANTKGGGVYVGDGTFTKTGGIIYGWGDVDSLRNKIGDGEGDAAYVSDGKKRDSTAGTGDDLDSSVDGSAGGWD